MKPFNILIVDGYSTGRLFPKIIRQRGMTPYHLTSGMEKKSTIPPDLLKKWIESQIGTDYAEAFEMPGHIDDILPVLKNLNLAAVIPGTESGVETAEYLAHRLGLPSNDSATSAVRRDKYLMQKAVEKAGLRSIPAAMAQTPQEAVRWYNDTGAVPVVIKPLKSASTDGVRICSSADEVAAHSAKLLGSADVYGNVNKKILLEKYIEGEEIAVNCVSRNGKHILTDIASFNKIVMENSFPVYDAMRLVRNPGAACREAVEYTFKVLDALGVKYGASHTEILLTADGPVLVESAARLTGLVSESYGEALGYNLAELALDSYIDEAAHNKNAARVYAPVKSHMVKSFRSYVADDITALPAADTLKKLPGVRDILFSHTLNSKKLHKTVDMVTRPGDCVFLADDEKTITDNYKICRLLETCASGLLYKTANGAPPSPAQEKIYDKIKNGIYPEEEIRTLFHGYKIAYKHYKNSYLYVLKPDLTPCMPGEEGIIYASGPCLTKTQHKLPGIKPENFIPNPFYTTMLDEGIQPVIYNTGDIARINEEGRPEFFEPKSRRFIKSFDKAAPRTDWPLTYAEKQMVTEYQMAPGSNAYNCNIAFKISGPLDAARLEEALNIWINRYRIFNSYYPLQNGKFTHRYEEYLPVRLNRGECAPGEALRRIKEFNKPFDINKPPLYRFNLFKTGEHEHLLHISMHHLICDNKSIMSVIEELWKLYENKEAKKFHLEEADLFDYAVWEQANDDGELKKQFFLDLYKEPMAENEMPIRSIRPEILPQAAEISSPLIFDTEKIKKTAKELGVSPAILVTTAASLALAKYCNSDDISLGCVMNGRSHPQIKETVGMFANVVPVRFRPKGAAIFTDYIKESAKVFKGAVENQTCPFELLAPVLAPQRNMSRKPVFDMTVNYYYDVKPFKTESLSISSVYIPQAMQIDMQFQAMHGEDNISITIAYSKELYHDEIINGILNLTGKILDCASDEACRVRKLADIMQLPQSETDKILHDFAGTREAWNLAVTPVEIFRRKAAEKPGAAAVKFLDRKLTYAQLDLITDNLAALLISKGIKTSGRAGLLLNRSEYMVVCALAVLKTGCAYVPLDPTYPAERLAFMLQDTAAGVLITDKELRGMVPNYKGHIIETDEIAAMQLKPRPEILDHAPTYKDDFVILYTSGTTGNPKGAALTHKNLSGICHFTNKCFSITPTDSVAACSSYGFDACLLDIYPTLTSGACVHIISADMRIDLPALNDYLNSHKITGMFLTTQLGRKFIENMNNKSLRYLIVSGETLLPVNPPANYKVYNIYGPTECTIYTTCFFMDKFYDRVPIGRTVSNSSIYIVDKNGQLAPVGAFGELCIAGTNVSGGYLNRPELTKEKFIPNPFNTDPDYRVIYRTGDIARFLPDGNVDFLGRSDGQVKVRGFRIELGEIEARIRKYEHTRDAAVVAKQDKTGAKYVVAYVVSENNIDIKDLQLFMEDELPPYMMPSFIMQIPAIPLNPNGKVDRRALPDPAENMQKNTAYAPPEGRIEKELAFVWAEILSIDADIIGREDSFFDLGGTSLRTTELALRIYNVFRENISPANIFKFPKLKDQAEYLSKHNRFPMVYAFNERGSKTPIFFIHTANTGAEAYLPLAAKLPPDQPFYAVEPYNIFGTEKPVRTIGALARLYVKFIRNVSPKGPYILGGWSFGAVMAYEIARILKNSGDSVEHLYLLDPVLEQPKEEQKLTKKLMHTSFFQDYLLNDPLFGRFKKLGLTDKLMGNNKAVMEDVFAYSLKPYGGRTTLFKSTKLPPAPGDMDKEMADSLRAFHKMHIDKKHNGLDKYVADLKTVNIDAIHDYFMRGNALEIIAGEIIKDRAEKCK